jgi:uncharacterized delta-60 repeat protein
MRHPVSPKLFFAITFLLCVSGLAQKGKPPACTKPTVAPPDTSCFIGPGCLDSSFNGTGFAVYEQLGRIRSVMTEADGRIVAVADGTVSSSSPTGRDLMIMKFSADGSRDTTFGDVDTGNPILRLGYTYIPVTTGTEFVQRGALQSDGKILAAGWSSGIWWVVRTLSDGSLDPTFSGDGIASFASPVGIWAFGLQPDGKMVVGGLDTNFNVTRLNADGSLDTSFGTNGTAVHNAGSGRGRSALWSVKFQRVAETPFEDRIVLGGWSTAANNGASSFALMRLLSDGSVDSTFGSSGKVSTSFFGTGDQVRELAVDPSNRIVAAGITRINSCSATDFGIARYTENGQLDASFGTQGKASLDLYNDNNDVYALTVQPDGKPIIGGNSRVLAADPVNRRYYFTLVRFDSAGNQDASFGSGTAGPGIVTTVLTGASASSYIFSLHQQPDGNILAGGTSIEKPALVRYLP